MESHYTTTWVEVGWLCQRKATSWSFPDVGKHISCVGSAVFQNKKARVVSWCWIEDEYHGEDFLFNKREQLKFFCMRKRCDQCYSLGTLIYLIYICWIVEGGKIEWKTIQMRTIEASNNNNIGWHFLSAYCTGTLCYFIEASKQHCI